MRIKLIGHSYDYKYNIVFYVTSDNKETLCSKGLRRKVKLPKNTKVIDVVFSKHYGKNRFRIKKTLVAGDAVYRLENVRESLYRHARKLLEEAYQKGYRYVHIEY